MTNVPFLHSLDPKRSSNWACENTSAWIGRCTGWSNCGTCPSFESKRVSGLAFSAGSRAARQEMLGSLEHPFRTTASEGCCLQARQKTPLRVTMSSKVRPCLKTCGRPTIGREWSQSGQFVPPALSGYSAIAQSQSAVWKTGERDGT
jgi:hypothetical protein